MRLSQSMDTQRRRQKNALQRPHCVNQGLHFQSVVPLKSLRGSVACFSRSYSPTSG